MGAVAAAAGPGADGITPSAKVSGLALLPAAARRCWSVARDYLRPDRRSRRLRLSRGALLAAARQFGVVLAMALLLSGWWYARNVALYGELTGVQTMLAVFGRRKDVFALGAALAEFRGFLLSYWGLLGTVNVVVRPVWALWALQGVLAAGWLGLYLAATGAGAKTPAPEQPAAATIRGEDTRRDDTRRGYAEDTRRWSRCWRRIVALHLLAADAADATSQGGWCPAIAAISLLTARGCGLPTPAARYAGRSRWSGERAAGRAGHQRALNTAPPMRRGVDARRSPRPRAST